MTNAAPALQAAPETCAHCSSPVTQLGAAELAPYFCCAGCRSVYEILQASGLSGYYSQQEPSEVSGVRPRLTSRRYQELDEPSFQAQHCQSTATGASVELLLEGVHCSACVWLVERVGRVVPGVRSSRLDLSRNVVSLSWDPERVQLSQIARGVAVARLSAAPAR